MNAMEQNRVRTKWRNRVAREVAELHSDPLLADLAQRRGEQVMAWTLAGVDTLAAAPTPAAQADVLSSFVLYVFTLGYKAGQAAKDGGKP